MKRREQKKIRIDHSRCYSCKKYYRTGKIKLSKIFDSREDARDFSQKYDTYVQIDESICGTCYSMFRTRKVGKRNKVVAL